MKGYKGFKKGLICKNKQYAENAIFEEPEAIPCKCGMHFCENPIDILDYYEFVNSFGEFNEFAEVEALDEPITNDNKKYCSKKLKIHKKLSFEKFINTCINFLIENINNISTEIYTQIINSKDDAMFALLGDHSKITNSGNHSKIASSGDSAMIINSGDDVQIGSLGDSANIISLGIWVKLISSGCSTKLNSSGKYAQIASSGEYSFITSSGYSTKIRSSGKYTRIANSGNYSCIGSSGNYTQIADSGNLSCIKSSGDYAKIVSSGNSAEISSEGKYSVICCTGNYSKVKAKKGSRIILSKWVREDDREIPKCVKAEYVDGERIKEDTFYTLIDGEFVEVEKDLIH